jgi:hypothetical protein
VRGDRSGREFLAFWLKDGRVLAGMNANIWDQGDDIRRSCAAAPPLTPTVWQTHRSTWRSFFEASVGGRSAFRMGSPADGPTRPLTSPDMTIEPLAPVPDDKDWTWVLDTACPDCGFDAVAIRTTDVASQVRGTATAFAIVLQRPGARDRPQPGVWSALEYGCHVRDVCRVFNERVRLMLSQDDPLFPDWDQDATALAERYWTQEPVVVTAELAAAAETVARSFEGVDVDQWSRPGRRSNGSVFTVDSLARYLLHDLVHHLHDIGA